MVPETQSEKTLLLQIGFRKTTMHLLRLLARTKYYEAVTIGK